VLHRLTLPDEQLHTLKTYTIALGIIEDTWALKQAESTWVSALSGCTASNNESAYRLAS
jgi:hypothetical protein